VVDSLNASTGQGLLVMYAAECAAAGYSAARVVAAARAMIPRTFTYGLIGSLDFAVRGGRLPAWVRRLADLFHVMPVLHADRHGRVTGGGTLFGRTDLLTSRFADRLKGNIRDSELVIFEGCAHAPLYEKVEEFNQKTLEFLQRHAGTRVA